MNAIHALSQLSYGPKIRPISGYRAAATEPMLATRRFQACFGPTPQVPVANGFSASPGTAKPEQLASSAIDFFFGNADDIADIAILLVIVVEECVVVIRLIIFDFHVGDVVGNLIGIL